MTYVGHLDLHKAEHIARHPYGLNLQWAPSAAVALVEEVDQLRAQVAGLHAALDVVTRELGTLRHAARLLVESAGVEQQWYWVAAADGLDPGDARRIPVDLLRAALGGAA